MRLFIAAYFDAATEEKLHEIQEGLSKKVQGRPTPHDQIHITLRFLGNVDANKIDTIEGIIANLALPDATIIFDGLHQVNRRFGNMIWANVRVDETVHDYLKQLNQSLSDKNIIEDKQGFRPHVTLMRKVVTTTLPEIYTLPFEGEIDTIRLMRSTLSETGAIHETMLSMLIKKTGGST